MNAALGNCAGKAAQKALPINAARMAGLERAGEMLGQGVVAAAIGIDTRSLRNKITADRGISNFDLQMTARALECEAERMLELAGKLRAETTPPPSVANSTPASTGAIS